MTGKNTKIEGNYDNLLKNTYRGVTKTEIKQTIGEIDNIIIGLENNINKEDISKKILKDMEYYKNKINNNKW
ncbi:hypothetical protein H3C61_03935 [Candidatus Gracilibacteria bacterium]|nr:hypothetical protein [Candidatus Gracilibacteria bacterium]